MRKVIALAFVIVPLISMGQNLRRIDSLKHSLVHTSAENRYKLLNDLAWEFRFAYPDSTVIYAQKAFTLANELQLQKDLARPLNYQGVAYNYKGERLKAYEFYIQALNLSTKQHDSIQIAHSNNNLGRLFFDQGLLAKAYDYFVQANAIFRDLKDDHGLAYTLQSLGSLQQSQKDFIQSENNFLQAYQIRLKLGNRRDIIAALIKTGRLYYERKEFSKSNAFLLKADSVCRYLNDDLISAEIKLLSAKNYIELGEISKAEQQAEVGAGIIQKLKFMVMLPETMITLGQIKFLKHDLSKAEFYFTSALKISVDIKDLQGQMDAYNHLWKLAESENKKTEAVQFMNQYLIRKDSIKDLDLTRQVERLNFQLEIEKKEKENELLRMNEAHQKEIIESQQIQKVALVAILFCAVSMAVALWYYSRKRRRTNLKLEAQNQFIELQRKQIEKRNSDLSTQNQKLADLNHEKDMLMNIVAHDLKSPLARISGLVNLLATEGNLSSSQKEYIQLLEEVTQSNIDLIIDLLDVNALQAENEIPHAVPTDVGNLLEERVASFQHSSISKKIELLLDHDIESKVISNPGYLLRIIDNLLSNAIKFSKAGSTVQVKGTLHSNVLLFSVKDDGPGFSDSDKKMLYQRFKKLSARPTAGESSNGLGLAIVKTLVERLRGEITLESEPGKGSEFTIRVPVKVVENISA